MITQTLKFVKQHYLRLDFSDLFYKTFLFIVGVSIFMSLIFIKKTTVTSFFTNPIIYLYAIFVSIFRLSRIGSAFLYKRSLKTLMSAGMVSYEPTITFIIPCKNEEFAIEKTITKCFEADYPKNKIEVIVINDGSTDKTLEVLMALKKQLPELVVVNWKKNKGKREGMAEGFRRANGEIVVQLDSDSYIDPKTIHSLINPFINPAVGGVCAHADPENSDKNWLTKIQAAYYFVSFKIQKAAESTFHLVFCLSGCCSAYRKDIVLPILDDFLQEKFLGLPITWGDDRSLTNWVIKKGYKTVYTDEAQAYTICPEDLKTFFKQQVRWKKGWFVNSVLISKFLYKEHPFVAFTYFFPLFIISIMTPFIAARALIYDPIVNGIVPIIYLLGIFLITALTVCYYRYIARENKYWPYIFIWSLINMAVLSFILFYALATIQNRKWGTR
ncbi:MAG: glycosyltransferase [bacterium]|nr:glycosyltransferase [bacterium]